MRARSASLRTTEDGNPSMSVPRVSLGTGIAGVTSISNDMVRYCVVNKVGIGGSGAYVVFQGWLFDSKEKAQQDLDKYIPKSQRGNYAVAEVNY